MKIILILINSPDLLSEENLLGSASRTKKIEIVHIVDSSIQHFRQIAVKLET